MATLYLPFSPSPPYSPFPFLSLPLPSPFNGGPGVSPLIFYFTDAYASFSAFCISGIDLP